MTNHVLFILLCRRVNISILFRNWEWEFFFLGNKHCICSFNIIKSNTTFDKSVNKSFCNCFIIFSWNLCDTDISYRNGFLLNVELKMFHMRYFIIFVGSENDKMSERGRGYDKMTLSSFPSLYILVYEVTVLRSNGKTYQSCSRHQSTSSWRRSGVQFL